MENEEIKNTENTTSEDQVETADVVDQVENETTDTVEETVETKVEATEEQPKASGLHPTYPVVEEKVEEPVKKVEPVEEAKVEQKVETKEEPKKEKKAKKQKEKRAKAPIWIIFVCLILSMFGGFGGAYAYNQLFPTKVEQKVIYQNTTITQGDSNVVYTTDEETRITTVNNIKDSVVEISTEQIETNFYYGEYVVSGAGSGVILTTDGYIVTNNHVIEGASNIKVTLRNGNTYEATLVGTDALTDIAVIKIEATDLTPVVLGDSESLQVGQSTIVIGNPLGSLGGSVSTGIISALSREITMEDGVTMNLLQTTAAVNPGNSGGGIFDLHGNLIGIVNAKSTGEDVEGLGFAIPINTAKPVITDLIEYGYVTGRPRLGVSIVTISTRQQAFSYGVNEYGQYVYAVEEGSAAEEAGIKIGDMIVGINDQEVTTETSLSTIISSYNVGDTIKVTVKRDREYLEFEVTLKEATN